MKDLAAGVLALLLLAVGATWKVQDWRMSKPSAFNCQSEALSSYS